MPTTHVEEVLKKIHILFAKGESYQNSPDMIILSKSEMFAVLEELNTAMYEVLDQYEATNRAKEMARLETEREASEIIAAAKNDAEGVHAASLVYTDTMLDELTQLVDATKDNIRREYLELLAKMDDRIESLGTNREDIKDRLTELHESDKYIGLLEEVRKQREAKQNAQEAPAADTGSATAAAKTEEEWPAEEKKPDPVIRVNKPGENTGVTFTTRHSHNKGKSVAGPVAAPETMSEDALSQLTEEERSALEQSTPGYGQGFKAEDFNLDAEWEQFKGEQAAESSQEAPRKKGFKLFGRKDK